MISQRDFVEIQSKSLINRVSGMPFRWSINPYRGCSHGCVFCMSGETPILLADWTTKPLDAIRVGDKIIGTMRRGSYRRYVTTTVLACWNVEKPAFRITLADGTELTASADHRFLTERGWKFVTGDGGGPNQRPHLTLNNHLIGLGTANGCALKSGRSKLVSIEPIGTRLLHDITTGTGNFVANGAISHNCYARRTHWFLDEDGVNQWSSKIFVKVNAPEVLRRELSRRGWKREQVALGTATDPYQAIEGKYKITRRILEVLCEWRTPVSIVTRSPMIVRDIDVLSRLARVAGATVCVSIATTDPRVAKEIEPTVAPPAQRFQAIETLSSAGIRAGVLLAPVVPRITDDPQGLEAVVESARRHRAHFVWHNTLHLGDITRDAFFNYLRARRPDLLPMYRRMYGGKYAPRSYRTTISRLVEQHKVSHHIGQPRYIEPPKEPEQTPLL